MFTKNWVLLTHFTLIFIDIIVTLIPLTKISTNFFPVDFVFDSQEYLLDFVFNSQEYLVDFVFNSQEYLVDFFFNSQIF